MRLARTEKRPLHALRFFLLSCFGPRFPRRGWTPHSCAPLHSDAVFALTGLGNRERRIREPCYSAAVNTILQLRAIFFCCSLCFSFFLFRSLLLLFLRSISRWTGRWKGGERERNERATTPSGLVLPTLDRRLFSRRSPPNPVYLPEIYIYILYFRRCFAFVFHRTMKETLRTICSLYFSSNRRGKNFHLRM